MERVAIIRETFGDQSRSALRAELARTRPAGYELMPTFTPDIIKHFRMPFLSQSNFEKVDPEKVSWIYAQIDQKSDVLIQVRDCKEKSVCVYCHMTLDAFDQFNTEKQRQGIMCSNFKQGDLFIACIRFYWRTCSETCKELFEKNM